MNRVDPLGLNDEEFERERRGQASGERPRNKALDDLEDALDKEQEAREAAENAQRKAERARQRHEDRKDEQSRKERRRSLNEAEKLADDAKDRARDAERAADAVEEALERAAKDGEAAGALRKAGPRIWERLGKLAKLGKRIGKLVPGLGAVLALLFLPANVYAKGVEGAVADGLTDAIPGVGTAKGVAELVSGVDMIPDLDDPRRKPRPVCGDGLGGLLDEPLRGDTAGVSGGSRTR